MTSREKSRGCSKTLGSDVSLGVKLAGRFRENGVPRRPQKDLWSFLGGLGLGILP